eukprot:TRINITY_DN1525_c0_g2_i1.p1 TRINITY_DN1525_c0_g2~~TRINITY_DN1525_c0_g2_i1.p1  ORF type:complete len:556 (-),score=152.91 TRINITY_DN1525_c0_g2_i1:12-1679(-)
MARMEVGWGFISNKEDPEKFFLYEWCGSLGSLTFEKLNSIKLVENLKTVNRMDKNYEIISEKKIKFYLEVLVLTVDFSNWPPNIVIDKIFTASNKTSIMQDCKSWFELSDPNQILTDLMWTKEFIQYLLNKIINPDLFKSIVNSKIKVQSPVSQKVLKPNVEYIDYVVSPYDTVNILLLKFNINKAELVLLNNFNSNVVLQPGQKIKVPKPSVPDSGLKELEIRLSEKSQFIEVKRNISKKPLKAHLLEHNKDEETEKFDEIDVDYLLDNNDVVKGKLIIEYDKITFKPKSKESKSFKIEIRVIKSFALTKPIHPTLSCYVIATKKKAYPFLVDQEDIHKLSEPIEKHLNGKRAKSLVQGLDLEIMEKQSNQPTSPLKRYATLIGLGQLNNTSSLLNTREFTRLRDTLPRRFRDRNWVLLFSTETDGTSLTTFYKKASKSIQTVLLIGEKFGGVFGGFATETWSPKEQFYGTSECFLFSFQPAPKFYKSTQANDYYMRSTSEGIDMGCSDGNFGIHINSDFEMGSSDPCSTYLNNQLSQMQCFKITVVELWGITK